MLAATAGEAIEGERTRCAMADDMVDSVVSRVFDKTRIPRSVVKVTKNANFLGEAPRIFGRRYA